MTRQYETIIIGAGSAGCTLANRLSAQSARSVLLVEAGEDWQPGQEPVDVRDSYPRSYYNPARMWPNVRAHWRRRDNSPEMSFPQGRGSGGSSSVMGMVALRGVPADYDEWEELGAHGWGWSQVLPFFKRLETDLDFDGSMHGQDGPMPIRRIAAPQWPPLTHAIAQYAKQRDIPFIADMNADFRDGFGTLPISNRLDRRASAATSYLTEAVRRRPNLDILDQTTVTDLVFDGRRVTGISVSRGGETRKYAARQVILAAGAIHSPAMLLSSGIGPGGDLQAVGIRPRAHLPGVGANLQNHAVIFTAAFLRHGARQDRALRTHPTTCFRMSSKMASCPESDLYINIQSKTSWNALGRRIANLAPVLWRPMSRGTVRLTQAEDGLVPLVEFNFMSDERDVARMKQAFATVADILAAPQVSKLLGRPLCVTFNGKIRQLNQLSKLNAVKAAAAASAFDVMPGLADRVLKSMSGTGREVSTLAANDERLTEYVSNNVGGMFHAAGTCRMGPSNDPNAVVDASGRVHGIDGLRVVDASIMPTVPRGNTNIPTIMLAEKVSQDIVDDL